MLTLTRKLTFADLRERAGFKKKTHLANQLSALGFSITPANVSAWELGLHKPKLFPKDVKILCEVLNCTLDELIIAFAEEDENT